MNDLSSTSISVGTSPAMTQPLSGGSEGRRQPSFPIRLGGPANVVAHLSIAWAYLARQGEAVCQRRGSWQKRRPIGVTDFLIILRSTLESNCTAGRRGRVCVSL